MPTQEAIPGVEQSPFGERSFARLVLKHLSDSIDTNPIKPNGGSSVCVAVPDEKTVVFELRSADTTSRAVFDQHNSVIRCERDRLTISRALAHRTFMYSYYFSYRKSLVVANTETGELVVRQDEDAAGIPYSGVRRVWSKYEKLH